MAPKHGVTDSTDGDTVDTAGGERTVTRGVLFVGFWLFVGAGLTLGLVVAVLFALPTPIDTHGHPDEEVTVEYSRAVVTEGDTVQINVIDETGEPVNDVDVVVRGDRLAIDEPGQFDTGPNSNTVRISVHSDPARGDITPEWRRSQDTGTLSVELRPPADSGYDDTQENPKVTILRGGAAT